MNVIDWSNRVKIFLKTNYLRRKDIKVGQVWGTSIATIACILNENKYQPKVKNSLV